MRIQFVPSLILSAALAPLAAGLQGPIQTPSISPEPAQGGPRADEVGAAYRALAAEYDAAVAAHNRALRDAPDRATRKALRKDRVEPAFWPRFEELAAKGSGRATLWLARHVTKAGLGPKDMKARRAELYRTLVRDFASARWFGDALSDLDRARRDLGVEWLRESLAHVAEVNPSEEVRAQALGSLAKTWLGRDGDEARAIEVLTRLSKEFPDTKPGKDAADKIYELEHLAVGKPAPDFAASTIDGYDFKLSDFRGKAVLLDFYGFW